MRKFRSEVLAVITLVGLVVGSDVQAAVPSQITVQGKLTNPSGVPALAGTKTFTFRIFDAVTGGTQIWPAIGGEVQPVITDIAGLWSAAVGQMNPLSDAVFSGIGRWLEITVDDGVNPAETLSRMKINSDAYAFRISTVDGAQGGKITSKVTIGSNTNSGTDGFVAGLGNWVNGEYSVIPGGTLNQAFSDYACVSGGEQNRAVAAPYAAIGGGLSNTILSGTTNTIVGGFRNRIETANMASVGGGANNDALAEGVVVGGGGWNAARHRRHPG